MTTQKPVSDVAREVRAELAGQRMTGAELARRLGRSQSSLQRRLAGKVSFDVDELRGISKVLSVPLSRFLWELTS